jgi:hypothetical protein
MPTSKKSLGNNNKTTKKPFGKKHMIGYPTKPGVQYCYTNAELVDLYFGEAIQVASADDGEGMEGKFYRVCECGCRILLGNGYQNLINHIVAIGGHASTWK